MDPNEVVLWLSLVIRQIVSPQLVTSSENLVASAQYLVALATTGSQFRALYIQNTGLINWLMVQG